RAPTLPRSSSTTKSRPTSFRPSARSRSAAASCAARMPFASQAPRPYTYSSSSPEAKCGGTVSRWVENTSLGGAPDVATSPGRAAQALAPETGDGAAWPHLHVAQRRELGHDGGEAGAIAHGQGDAPLRGRHDAHRQVMAVEHLELGAQEPVVTGHAGGADLDE